MVCTVCGRDVRVTDTLPSDDNCIYRRRKCLECGHSFFTMEIEIDILDRYHSQNWKRAYELKEKTRTKPRTRRKE